MELREAFEVVMAHLRSEANRTDGVTRDYRNDCAGMADDLMGYCIDSELVYMEEDD